MMTSRYDYVKIFVGLVEGMIKNTVFVVKHTTELGKS